MDIRVPVRDDGYLATAKTWEDVARIVDAKRPALQALAQRAFVDNDRASWEEAQRLLYHWNLDDLERRGPATSYTRMLRQILRNMILEVYERAATPLPALASLSSTEQFSSDRAIRELYDVAKSHRINSHPLLAEMQANGLPKDVVRLFLENYYVNNRVFHLHIASLSLSSPLALRGEMYKNLNDELGQAVHDRAHPIIFQRNFNSIGRPEVIEPLAESLNLLNVKVYACFLSGDYRIGVGGMGFLELAMPPQMSQIHKGLLKSGLPEEDLEFWPLHAWIDEQHGENWFEEMRQVIRTPEDARAALRGGVSLLDARAGFYDGIWNALTSKAAQGDRKRLT